MGNNDEDEKQQCLTKTEQTVDEEKHHETPHSKDYNSNENNNKTIINGDTVKTDYNEIKESNESNNGEMVKFKKANGNKFNDNNNTESDEKEQVDGANINKVRKGDDWVPSKGSVLERIRNIELNNNEMQHIEKILEEGKKREEE